MSQLIASVSRSDPTGMIRAAEAAWSAGADMVELRIDAVDGDLGPVVDLVRGSDQRRWIITCRSAAEGGRFFGTPAEKARHLRPFIATGRVAIDLELAEWEAASELRELMPALPPAESGRPGLILSAHRFEGLPRDAAELIQRMLAVPGAIAKLAFTAEDALDGLPALDLLRQHGRRLIAVAMGDDAVFTRILAKKFDAFGTYCTLGAADATAPGQLSLEDMGRFRWERIDAGTKVYGLLGDPVSHSLSPLLFNHWFDTFGINAVYVPLRIADRAGRITEFFDACAARPWLDFSGFSVTVPHKEAALAHLRDAAAHLARHIGAVNTVCFRETAAGYNTDCFAALDSILDALGCDRADLPRIRVDVLGAGGAARAVVAAVTEFGSPTTVYARNQQRARELAEAFACSAAAWEDRLHRAGDVLLNATPIGMWPQADASPMPPDRFDACRLVFDLVYRPMQTRLLVDAAAAGCRTLSGLDMFVRQAAAQCTLWTGRTPDRTAALALLTSTLAESEAARPATHKPGFRTPAKSSIALIGLRGSGKTTVGRELARRRGCRFVDTDDWIVQSAGRTIAELFAAEGEAGFRKREVDAVANAAGGGPAIISVGGGAVLDPKNVRAIRNAATIVWLSARVEVLWERVQRDSTSATMRPRLTAETGIEELRELLVQRAPLYESVADLVVDTSNRSAAQVAEHIAAALDAGA